MIQQYPGGWSRAAIVSSLVCAGLQQAVAQEALDELEPLTVISNRIEETTTTASVSTYDGAELSARGITTLRDALDRVPGVYSTSTAGQRGQTGSLFIRGATTDQSQTRIDGIRISGSQAFNGNFLGLQGINAVDRLEVLRGPQGALYGSDSIGGIVALNIQRGQGEPRQELFLEGGSFGTIRGSFSSQGQTGDLSYVFSIFDESTENAPVAGEVADFDRRGLLLRLDYDVRDALTVGLTLRRNDAEFFQIGRAGGQSTFLTDTVLATVFADLEVNDVWSSKLTLGIYEEDYEARSSFPNMIETQKESVEWLNTLEWSDQHTTVVGIGYETTEFSNSGFGLAGREEDITTIFANHVWRPIEALSLSGGVRYEDYDVWGDVTTWRGTASYDFYRSGTTVRASVGRGFRAPNFQELFGLPAFGEVGNPNLQPESSQGWEIGIDQELGRAGQLSVTWFRNNVEDAIADPFGGAPFNQAGTTRAQGLEIAYGVDITNELSFDLNWTQLDDSIQTGLPERMVNAALEWEPCDKVMVGLGMSHVGERTFGAKLGSYTLTRLYGSWEVNETFTLTGRVENLFDESYEFANFGNSGPTLNGAGVGAFLGVKATF